MKTELQIPYLTKPRKSNVFLKSFFSPNTDSFTQNFSKEEKARIIVKGQSGKETVHEICKKEGITPATFYKWTQEFLKIEKDKAELTHPKPKVLSEDDKFSIVIEGKSGASSVAEICKRENISQDIFLEWSREFLEFRKLKNWKLDNSKSAYLKNRLLFKKFNKLNAFHYLENFIDFSKENQLIISNEESIKLEKAKQIENIVSLKKINDVRYINKYFEKINKKLPEEGFFTGCFETFSARKNRKNINKVPLVREVYFFSEFIFKRIIPKLSYTKGLYFDITKGNDRLLSKAEGLGRLASCGFKIMDYKSIDGLVYFVVKKIGEPSFDDCPSYGPVYKMPRISKNGKMIKVFKFRTMHPYSEYLQEYMVKTNGYSTTGKPANDFRIPTWGKIMRKYWLDELPQLINVVKGDMKLVGIRPLSKVRFDEIPKEMQRLRLTQKPGCVPPYIALNRDSDVISLLQSEKEYIEERIKNPYTTDLTYFFKAIFNIVFKHKRSA